MEAAGAEFKEVEYPCTCYAHDSKVGADGGMHMLLLHVYRCFAELTRAVTCFAAAMLYW